MSVEAQSMLEEAHLSLHAYVRRLYGLSLERSLVRSWFRVCIHTGTVGICTVWSLIFSGCTMCPSIEGVWMPGIGVSGSSQRR
jgi:hypothetical protein